MSQQKNKVTKKNKKVSKKRVALVTGGAGFIGSHLIESLIKDGGYEVYSLDNYFSGTEENHLRGATYIKGHTKDINRLIKVIPDVLFHLGEYSRVETSFNDMHLVWEFNKVGTYAVLEFCRKHNVKLIYAGSSTKFGDGGMGRDQSPYAWTKASNTELVRNYSNWYGLKYAITYFYNVYGPREISKGPYATVIGIFKERHKKGEPLHVVSPGTQVRNFTHIDDIVDGLVKVGERGEGDDYGLGYKEGYSILEIARMFGRDVVMLPERKGNRMNTEVDVLRAEKELNWHATKNIKDHINEFVKNHSKKKPAKGK